MPQQFQHLNWLHILVAALAYFVIGAIWYGGLFSKAWAKGHGVIISEEEKKKAFLPTMLGGLIITFIIVTCLAIVYLYVPPKDITHAVKYGAFYGLGFAGLTTAMNYLYLQKPLSVWFIDILYNVVGMIVASIILCLWDYQHLVN